MNYFANQKIICPGDKIIKRTIVIRAQLKYMNSLNGIQGTVVGDQCYPILSRLLRFVHQQEL